MNETRTMSSFTTCTEWVERESSDIVLLFVALPTYYSIKLIGREGGHGMEGAVGMVESLRTW